MKKQDIVPGDFYRILFGETPVIFMLEVFLRTLLVYIALLVIVRLMGKRMGGQLTINEFAVMLTLGAIVSPGMQMPQTGLLLSSLILFCALIFERSTHWMEFKSKWFERWSQGTYSTLVEDGVLQLEEMQRTRISRQQLFSVLRQKDIYNLGDIERVYLEACGIFSVYQRAKPAPGLLLFPREDTSMNGFKQNVEPGQLVCANCGATPANQKKENPCPVCNADQWGQANISIREDKQQEG